MDVVTLLYFWPDSPEFAKRSVLKRVQEGGHNIPPDIVERRYYRGISNLMKLYIPVCDNWMIVDNINPVPQEIALGVQNGLKLVINIYFGKTIQQQYKSYGH